MKIMHNDKFKAELGFFEPEVPGTQYLFIEPDAGLLKILPNLLYNNR